MSAPAHSLGRLLLWSSGAAVAVALATAFLLWFVVRERLRSEAVDHGQDLCQVLAGEIGLILQQPATSITRAAEHLDAGDDPHALDRYLRSSSLISQVLTLDRQGRITGSFPENRELLGLDWSRQPLFQDAGGGVTWSNTHLAPDLNGPATTITRPWKGGLVVFRIDLTRLNTLTDVITPPPGGFVAVLDRQGVVIGHSHHEMPQRRESLRDLLLADARRSLVTWRGVDGLLSRSDIPATSWTVAIFQPTEHAFAAAREAALLTLAALTCIIILFLSLALLTRSAVNHALSTFAAHMRRFAEGRVEGALIRFSEFQPLADNFLAMAAAIRSRENELERSRAEFRNLVEGVESVILRLHPDGRIAYLNPAGERTFGWSNAEAQGQDVRKLLVPNFDAGGQDLHVLIDAILAHPDRFRNVENENVTKTGERVFMTWANRPILDQDGKLLSILSVGTDVSERHRQDEAFKALIGGMAAVAGDDLYDAATASLAGWLGCQNVMIARVDGDHFQALSLRTEDHIDHGHRILIEGTPCAKALADGWYLRESALGRDFPADAGLAKSGAEAYAGIAIPGSAGTGKSIGVLACLWNRPLRPPLRLREVLELVARRVGIEIERTEVLHALESSRAILHGFLEHVPGPAAITDAQGRIVTANGHDPAILNLTQAGQARDKVELDGITTNDNGVQRHWHIIRFPMPGGLTGHLATDETERHDLHQRLAHAQRLDSLGKLAGGVAHDFNNQLAGIMGFAELLGKANHDERDQRYIEGILAAARRSAALTAKLLAFARKGGVTQAEVDLHHIITETAQFVERTIDRRIAIETRLEADRHLVLGDPGLIQNALLNLALNARDSMPEGGRLCIRSRLETLPEGSLGSGGERLPAGEHLRIDVVDSGIGMDGAVRARLFEPFFTTKPSGKGNGLGLAAVYGTVTAMHGGIVVASAPGQGSTFSLHLPLLAGRARMEADDLPDMPRGHGNILVAEDEDLLRDLTCERLEALGYTAFPAYDGQDAIEQFQANPAGFDLILLDLIMPRMNGSQALAAIRAISAWIPVVVASGYGADTDLAGFRNLGIAILAKPYSTADLAQTLATTLAGRPR